MTQTYLITQNVQALVVGTAIIREPGAEPQEGRILTFSLGSDGSRLCLLSQTRVPGCVYAVAPIDGKLVASINGMTGLYRWSRTADSPDRPHAWTHLHSHFGQVLGVKLDTCGELIVVGDLMKSAFLLRLDESGERLVEMARDYEAHWMTEVRFIDHGQVLGADNLGNVFVMAPTPDKNPPGGQQGLRMRAAFHLGEIVNKIDAGTLARRMTGQVDLLQDPQLLGTTCGGVYQFGRLNVAHYKLLKAIERNVIAVASPVGGLSHTTWREMATDLRKPAPPVEHFVDGDAVLKFLELPEDLQKAVIFGGDTCAALPATAKEVHQILEMLLEAVQ